MAMAIEAWNLMGGLDWAALPTVFEILDIEDVDSTVGCLLAIREHMKES